MSSTVDVRMFMAVVLLKFTNPALYFSDLYAVLISEYGRHLSERLSPQALYRAIFENRDRWFVVTPAEGDPPPGDENIPHVVISFCEERHVRRDMFLRFQQMRWKLKTAPRPGLLQIVTEASNAVRILLAHSREPEIRLPLIRLPEYSRTTRRRRAIKKTAAAESSS